MIRASAAANPDMDPLLVACSIGRAYLEANMDYMLATAPGFTCHRGCSHCCRLDRAVEAPRYESEIVALYIKRVHADRVGAIRDRIRALASELHALPAGEYPANRTCPLLDEAGECSVYPVRPTVCLAYCARPVHTCASGGVVEVLAQAQVLALMTTQVVDEWSDGLPWSEFFTALAIELDRGTEHEIPGLEPRGKSQVEVTKGVETR